ncbi:hypothetical protein TWF696_008464 [Orbilia brochopaga]|uniref:WSC domain-containing protein n=1 Tax=Orbilia brochopaga TaxID=3140254 RepID=A0AAV9UH09_9PEZI
MKFLRSTSSGLLAVALAVLNWVPPTLSLGDTDTITSCGDISRSGYETNHNMDPAIVASSDFDKLWAISLPRDYQYRTPSGNIIKDKDQVFAQPLVYTPSSGTTQYVYVSTAQNTVYKIDAKTGDIVAWRALAIPFLSAELDGCLDINPFVGNTATGVIDPATNTWYLTIKTYRDQSDAEKGRLNGRYYIYAISCDDLSDRPNFPVPLEDLAARNNPKRLFKGGNQHQRPALLQHGQFIYMGFASHCVQYNYSGWLVGCDKTSGDIVESYAMEGGPEDINVRGGGIWMSGGGIASDGRGSMFFSTGNGYSSQLHGTPVPGNQPPTALEEAAVHALIQDNGQIVVKDFFMPYEKETLDGNDQDLGTSPLNILPLSCPNARRIGCVTGKSGKTYLLNLDNLGGYCNGPNRQDAVLATYLHENSVYAGAGVYPTSPSSGYIYINVIKYPTRVFQFSCNAAGNPQIVALLQTDRPNGYTLGVGHGTTTSFPGKENSGLLWISDVNNGTQGLRIYKAVPENGNLPLVRIWPITGVTKFQKPVFGNGIAYVATNQGLLYAFGSAVNSPLDCTDPNDLGSEEVGSTGDAKTVTCTAKTAVQITGASLSSNTNFKLGTVPSLPATVAQGSTFSFTVQFTPQSVGSLSANVFLNTTQQAAGFSKQTVVGVKGTGHSSNGYLTVSPTTVAFSRYITGSSANGVDQDFIIENEGGSSLTINSYQVSTQGANGPWSNPTINGNTLTSTPFTFNNIPAVNSQVSAGTEVNVNANFNAETSNAYKLWLKIASTGGTAVVAFTATSYDAPTAKVEFQSPTGGWVPFDPNTPFDFGDVLQQNKTTLLVRVTNTGGPNADILDITVSKPPVSNSIISAVNSFDLGEGTQIAPGESATAQVYCSVPRSQVNVDSYDATAVWVMNTNGFQQYNGKITMQFVCNAVSQQYGPMSSPGVATYRYIGCARENNPGRQLPYQQDIPEGQNDNQACIKACFDKGFEYAGTQYLEECWCGHQIPVEFSCSELDCNYGCELTDSETCGGNGNLAPGTFMSVFARSDVFDKADLWPCGTKKNQGTGTTTPAPVSTNPAEYKGYENQGCWKEPASGKAMSNMILADQTGMTIEKCIDAAIAAGYDYCGVEYAFECWAGSTFSGQSTKADEGECSSKCPGNPGEWCGAPNRFNYYRLNRDITTSAVTTTTGAGDGTTTTVGTAATTTSAQGNPESFNGYTAQGCYVEPSSGGKALANQILNGNTAGVNGMTVEKCINAAKDAGYIYAGVEYGVECWAGNTIRPESQPANSPTECSMSCSGNSTQRCGGNDRINVYLAGAATSSTTTTTTGTVTAGTTSSQTTTAAATTTTGQVGNPETYLGYVHNGCYAEPSTGPKAFPTQILNGDWAGVNGMTVEKCLEAAKALNFGYAGLEYGGECWAYSSIAPAATSAASTDCNMGCTGNTSQKCGGGNRFNYYSLTSGTVSTTAATATTTVAANGASSSTTTTAAAATTTTAQAGNPQTYRGYEAQGCYVNAPPKVFAHQIANDNTPGTGMTPERCIDKAIEQGYQYCGVEYGRECWADTTMAAAPTKTVSTECTMPCPGNPLETCGNGNRIDVYILQPTPLDDQARAGSTTTATTTAGESSTAGVAASSTLSSTTTTIASSSSTTGEASSSTGADSSTTGDASSSTGADSSTTGDASSSTSADSSTSATVSSSTADETSSTSAGASSTASSSNGEASSTTADASSTTASTTAAASSSTTSHVSSLTTTAATSSATSSSLTPTTTATTTRPTTTSSVIVLATTTTFRTTTRTTTTRIVNPTQLIVQVTPGPSTQGPVTFTTLGCFFEPTGTRALSKLVTATDGMNLELCASACATYSFVGIEYARECWCGNTLVFQSSTVMGTKTITGGGQAAASDCKSPCKGNPGQICGAGNRLDVYYQGTPLLPATATP